MRFPVPWSLRGLLLAAMATLACLPAPAVADEEPQAPPPRPLLSVATQFRAYAGFQPRPEDPLDRMPAGRALALRLGDAAAAGLAKGLERDDGAFGRVRWARRDVLVALYAPPPGSLRIPLLCVDQDGDGAFDSAGEQRRVATYASERGQRWSAELTVGGVPGVLEVERAARARRIAVLDRGGVRRVLPPELPPPGGVLLPGGGTADLLARLRMSGRDVLVGVAFTGRGATAGATVHVDLDGDRRLDALAEAFVGQRVEAAAEESAWRVSVPMLSGDLVLQAEERPERIEGTLSPPGALRGTVNAGGRTLALFLLDGDLDGALDSADDLWWLGPVERLARVQELASETMSAGDDPIFVAGAGWRVSALEADGTVQLVVDPQARVDEVMARRHLRSQRAWAARLEAEAGDLRAANGLDVTRPRATAEPAWRFATALAGPLEQARQEQRPVLAFFESDWCRWCKRLDLHTFLDAEVSSLMARFACVRLNYDFLTADDYERCAGRGLPLLLLLDAEGHPLDAVARSPREACRTARLECFEAPQVFARRLEAALALWQARQQVGQQGGR